MKEIKLTYEEIRKIVDCLDDEEFLYLKEAVNERSIEENISEINPNNKTIDDNENNDHTYLLKGKQKVILF